MSGIFISYRHDDSAAWAARLSDHLRAALPGVNVFRDTEALPPAVEFPVAIANAASSCDVLIVVIGPHWLTDTHGRRRLDNPKDYVRQEIAIGLSRGIPIVPTLVDKAELPESDELPRNIRRLTQRQKFEISDQRWHHDVGTLIASLGLTAPPPQPRPRHSPFRILYKVVLALFCLAIVLGVIWHFSVTAQLSRSAQMMVSAFDALNSNDLNKAFALASDCVNTFGAQADGQQSELSRDGVADPPTGKVSADAAQAIFARGVLNDVGGCLFAKGRSAAGSGQSAEAQLAYDAASRLTYARVYDPACDCFWSPAASALPMLRPKP
jgi:hypothetical protein